ncbi:hypothetical protein SAMN04487821_103189 [Enterococcus malodoratus]|nr:hypothetical protein SAMN04487821_103189 [Enterococcus malodoratus]
MIAARISRALNNEIAFYFLVNYPKNRKKKSFFSTNFLIVRSKVGLFPL